MGVVTQRFLELRPYEILIFIIALILFGLCIVLVPLASSDVERAIRQSTERVPGLV